MEAVMAINRSTPENFVYDNTSKINKNFVYKNLKYLHNTNKNLYDIILL